MPVMPIRLVSADAERYTRIRLRMLTQAPWAYARTPDDDPGLDLANLAARLAEPEYAIFAVEEAQVGLPSGKPPATPRSELVAVAGIVRMQGPKFAHRAKVWGVFVEPAYRGRGLGRLVLQAAIDLARTWEGVDYVDLGVSENSPEALHLYQSLGFRVWGREPETTQYGDRRFDEIFMTLKL